VAASPIWIRTPDELAGLARELAETPAVAIDTEADSLHHYPERLCLIQVGLGDAREWLIDPLALADLEPLRPVFAARGTVKILHSADNDLAQLKRRYGFAFATLFDTALAARFLGVRELGLERLLATFLGVETGKSQQKTDWARRPLSPAQEAYAAEDVRHLPALRERLLVELRALGREAWLTEECEALASLSMPERPVDDEGYRRLRGASRLDRRGLSILRALHARREAWARAERRPPFKVLSPETLVALAAAPPRDRAALAGVPGLPARLIERYGDGILEAVARGLADPIPESPPGARPSRPVVLPVVRQRMDALRRWRAAAAERTGLEPGVLLPQRLIDLLAAGPPADPAGLLGIPGLRRWRTEAFGPEILEALASVKTS
jgi:ribonuclease D